ncbi:MAG: sigma-70 family RNA polymerase sigma factor [Acidobacteria bacterium]|nr:sigma-70 family RNA polymerase sigma factor [Acidobacteriota bacterium]
MINPLLVQKTTVPQSKHSNHKTAWTLTLEAIDKLLAGLGDDRETAGRAYQELRGRLTLFFECNRCPEAEELADETLNRVARKLSEGEAIDDLGRYALAVARFILKEYWRRPEKSAVSLDDSLLEVETTYSAISERGRSQAEADIRRDECMRRCLLQLPARQRKLLIEYYSCNSGSLVEYRREMAERRGTTPNALYIQIHRLRAKLVEWLEECMKKN